MDAPKVARATSPYFQLFFIAITSCVFLYLVYAPLKQVGGIRKIEQLPEILPITPERLKEFGGSPTTVNVGLYIRDFPEFDILKNDFVFAGIITLQFDPALLSLETVSNFSFQKGEILKISPPRTQMKHGLLIAHYDVRVKFKTNLNHAFFPFAAYPIHIVFDNYFVLPSEVIFTSSPSQFVTSPTMYLSGWKEYDRHVYTGYFIDKLDVLNPEGNIAHPRVVFALDYIRYGLREMLSILLPLILIFFVSIFAFSMDPEAYYKSILTLASGCITALLAYKFVIDNLSPRVGYFMLSDMLFFLFLTVTFVVFFFNTLTLQLNAHQKMLITVIMHSIVIGAAIYLFEFWAR